jgi:Fic family protein
VEHFYIADMIEKAPKIKSLDDAYALLLRDDLRPVFNKINSQYLYWDKVKYNVPKGIDKEIFWSAVKIQRMAGSKIIKFGKYQFSFFITEHMLQKLHDFDLNLGGNLGTSNLIPAKSKDSFLVSSIMEEAIASSQMEGASTTRRIAKDMLRKGMKPKDKSQQMIGNNYQTINHIIQHINDPFNIENILSIHRLISAHTMDNAKDEGNLRQSNDIVVMNCINGEIAHTPPAKEEIELLLTDLCDFANNDDAYGFIHPIIKSIIVHFMLAFIHPFADGNGRTARSLVYWYLVKNGYWLMQYLSISRIIYRDKASYEKAFTYTENDGYDLSYFIQYNLKAMDNAFIELKEYLQRKINEADSMNLLHDINGINERQAQLLKILKDKPTTVFTTSEISTRFGIDIKTARKDLQILVDKGFLEKRTPARSHSATYIRTENFSSLINNSAK